MRLENLKQKFGFRLVILANNWIESEGAQCEEFYTNNGVFVPNNQQNWGGGKGDDFPIRCVEVETFIVHLLTVLAVPPSVQKFAENLTPFSELLEPRVSMKSNCIQSSETSRRSKLLSLIRP